MELSNYKTIPIGSILLLEEEERGSLMNSYFELPMNVKAMAASPSTGAFVRGVAKNHDLPAEQSSLIALAILRVAVGDKTLAQLSSIFSGELRMPNDKAQQMAQEIEKELFAPVALELNQYLEGKKKTKGSVLTRTGGSQPPNVLDLKDTKRPSAPPPVPLK